MSNEKRGTNGSFRYIEDEILPSYIGIKISQKRILLTNQDDSWKVRPYFFRGSGGFPLVSQIFMMGDRSTLPENVGGLPSHTYAKTLRCISPRH